MSNHLQPPFDNRFKSSSRPFIYRETTKDIEISVVPEFLQKQSRSDQGIYNFAYHVTIFNKSPRRIQLLFRKWIVKDGRGQQEEIVGAGVIGEQPILLPTDTYSYSSGCPLRTPTGNMRGWYEFLDLDSREHLKIRIPLFFLRSDHQIH